MPATVPDAGHLQRRTWQSDAGAHGDPVTPERCVMMGDLGHDGDSGGLRGWDQATYAEQGGRQRVSGQRDNVSRGLG